MEAWEDPQEPIYDGRYDWQPGAETDDDQENEIPDVPITAPPDWIEDDNQSRPESAPVMASPIEFTLDPDSLESAIAWYPLVQPLDNPEIADDGATQIALGAEIREVSTKVLDMAARFNATQDKRIQFEHDCSVFAMATETGESYEDQELPLSEVSIDCDIDFWEGTADEVIESGRADAVPVGTVIFAGGGVAGSIDETKPFHYLVKISTDDGPALYASKFGVNPVCISGLRQVVGMYQARSLGIAHRFRIVPAKA